MYVYILYSKTLNKYYTGKSNNPWRRLEYHNMGKSGGTKPFTKRASDWEIVWTRKFKLKEEATLFEKKLKNKKSKVYIKRLITSFH